jgi:hypothetical protein
MSQYTWQLCTHTIVEGLLGTVSPWRYNARHTKNPSEGPQFDFEFEPTSCQSAMMVQWGSKKRMTWENDEDKAEARGLNSQL